MINNINLDVIREFFNKTNNPKAATLASKIAMGTSNPSSLVLRKDKGSKLSIEEMDNNLLYLESNGGGSITGTPSEIAYFDTDGNITGDENFTRDALTGETTIGSIGWILQTPVFSGTGLNDLENNLQSFTGPTSSIYTVTITSGTTPPMLIPGVTMSAMADANKFDWVCSTGASASGVTITRDFQELDNGVYIRFITTIGHTINDSWTFGFTLAEGLILAGSQFGNYFIGNVMFTDNILGLNIIDSSSSIIGIINQQNNDNSLFQTATDGSGYSLDMEARFGSTYSSILLDTSGLGIRFSYNTGEYYFPTTNSAGYGALVNDGNGLLGWVSGYSGTYSTGDGGIVTVNSGIITGINYV